MTACQNIRPLHQELKAELREYDVGVITTGQQSLASLI